MTSFYSLGLMSGSSLDGLDICYSRIDVIDDTYGFEIIYSDTISFPDDILISLKTCRELSETELYLFDLILGKWIGNSCLFFIKNYNISNLNFICSHGHTVYHYPNRGKTLQIGNGHAIANISNTQVINNLRQRDIDHGGSGAPIVPIGDLLLFADYKYCLNLGGIMNISVKKENKIYAYDIGACNQVINQFSLLLGQEYDKDGLIAKSGSFNQSLFNELNMVDFFHLDFPKSLDNSFCHSIINLINKYDLSIPDKLNTFYHHIAHQIMLQIENNEDEILCTGGGTHNSYLLDLFVNKYKLKIIKPNNDIIDNKEALVMSLIGVRYLEDKHNVLASVTGASQDTICGYIYLPML